MKEFSRIQRLPPYVFSMVDEMKAELLKTGETVFDFGMGNPDQPTPPHIVQALKEAADNPRSHRYSVSRGIRELRSALCNWYGTKFNVDLDPETEVIATIGSKEGLAHLALALMGAGDIALVPNPAYPIHPFGFVIAGSDVRHVPMLSEDGFVNEILRAIKESWPKPKVLVLNFPSNPTTQCVNLSFFKKIVDIAKEHGIYIIHDFAYADIVFDGYKAPSILQVPGAKDIAVESYTLSKSYNMPGWRVGFLAGNKDLIATLRRIKSYLDYGIFTPIQRAAVEALTGPQDCVREIRDLYQSRRDFMCEHLAKAGWQVEKPKATMFLWAKIPKKFRHLGSISFTKLLLEQAHVAVSPGIGFGEYGNDYVRISLIENEENMLAATNALKGVLKMSVSKAKEGIIL